MSYEDATNIIYIHDSTVTKIIRDPFLDETLLETTAREAMMTLRARRIIKFVPNVYQINGTSLTLERIFGQTLGSLIPTLSLRQMDELVAKIREMVLILNKNSIFHGDLHVDNIIIDKEQPWIIDFGQASHKETSNDMDRLTRSIDYTQWL